MDAIPEPFARVVCGVDGTEAGLTAVRQALRLRPSGSELLLVAVSESRIAVHAGMLAGRAADELDAEARRGLDEASALAADAPARLVHGRAAEAFLAAVAEADATLAAVGSHEHGRGLGYVLGSVATRVLHDASCSVLLARATGEPERFPRAIVAGVDGSPHSLRAAAVAGGLGERLGAPVTCVVARGASPDELDHAALERSGLEVTGSDERPVAALVAAAAGADLVVVGSRGVRGIRALGSVGERVAHDAPCSVLVVR
jgi:nucleotide-binding universal stress UspA family protein